MESFVITGKAKDVFKLVALKAKAEQINEKQNTSK
jgi:hypothetical protein